MSALDAPARLATVRTIPALRATLADWRRAGQTIGLVPTMGALHAGHLALVRRARAECDRVVATIFVNPIQFDRTADLERYPRDEARDAAPLSAAGVDLLFAPSVEEMYPAGFATTVSVSGLTDCLCGATRPGHLTGVTTVVSKLLLQALPDVAYFGEKDYQQLLVVRRMVRDLDIPARIAAVPTVREADGLALSSRNACLTADQRARAPAVHRVLAEMAARLAGGEPAGPVLAAGRQTLGEAGFERIDYLDLRDGETLAALERARPPARLFVAAWLGPTRLIDNVPVV
ncbi:MAG: pantoate--beta-alanine ligase [Kiloniellaceae bacterium]